MFWRAAPSNLTGILFAGPWVFSFSILFTRISCPLILCMILSYILQQMKTQPVCCSLFRDHLVSISPTKTPNRPPQQQRRFYSLTTRRILSDLRPLWTESWLNYQCYVILQFSEWISTINKTSRNWKIIKYTLTENL